MSRKPKIEVIKVETSRPACRPKKFPPQPRMYLELLENKSKIKQDLINKEHISRIVSNYSGEGGYEVEEDNEPRRVNEDSDNEDNYRLDESEDEIKRSDSEDDVDRREYRKVEKSDSESESSKSSRDKGYKLSSPSSSSSSPDKSDSDSSDDDTLSKRIKQLLKKDKKSTSPKTPSSASSTSSFERYSRSRSGTRPNRVPEKQAPSLKDLENQGIYQGKKHMRDLNQTTVTEQNEEDLKRELLYKFEILKKSYNNVNVPEFSIHSDYNSMLKTYEMTVKKVNLESNVDTYKSYLIYGFMGVEFVFSNFFKFDMQGFTQQQIVSMNSYEKLLIELGEKSYVPKASSWPVELRLLFMILMNAGFFILTKMLMKKTGANLLNMINNMGAPPATNTSNESFGQKKRKMKGPDVNLDNIPDL